MGRTQGMKRCMKNQEIKNIYGKRTNKVWGSLGVSSGGCLVGIVVVNLFVKSMVKRGG